jgi:hypothetical protein
MKLKVAMQLEGVFWIVPSLPYARVTPAFYEVGV